MDGFVQLIVFSTVMLVGSYGAGYVPLFMPMSEEKLHLVSVMGAGLLVGVAFAVIVPEGVQTLIKAYQLKEEDQHHAMEGLDKAVGVSLVLGFLFMLLIDQIATSHSSRGAAVPNSDPEASRPKTRPSAVSWTTTLGLVVHAAADGIALGAAAATNQMDVELIVFLAIMLHKAPAAFGLVTFLLHENLERFRIRKHLIAFSFSAPVMAVLTYGLLVSNKSDSSDGKVRVFLLYNFILNQS